MNAFLYGTILQFKLDIRSKSILITCYVVPLLFFLVMGGIFTSVTPEMKHTLIASMTILGISMGALIGLPPTLAEIYGTDIKKVYKANGVPLYLGLVSVLISTFVHMLIMSTIILAAAPLLFDAVVPVNLPLYFCSLSVIIIISLSIGSILGLAVKSQARLTMITQLVFLPSIMLSGIMFPADLLPTLLKLLGKLFPAAHGYLLLTSSSFQFSTLLPLLVIFAAAVILCRFLLKNLEAE